MGQGSENIVTLLTEMTSDCTSCGECVRSCAFLKQYGTPAGIAQTGIEADNLRLVYGCSLCGLCDAVCPEMLSPSAMFLAMRHEAAKQNLVDLKPYKPWLNYEKLGSYILFRRNLLPAGCTTVFFPGCSLSGIRPVAVRKLFKQLRQIEPSAGLVLDCCGKISRDLGLTERFETIFGKLLTRLKKHGINRILTSCPGCSKIFRQYGERFEVSSIYESIAGGAAFTSVVDGPSVAVHDPCPARFDSAQQKAVRSLIQSCGYRVVELPSSGSTTRCCGQGGMVEGCVPGTVRKESGVIAAETTGHPVISYCAACSDTLAAITQAAHITDLLTDTPVFTNRPVSSARRWLNRLKLRFERLT